MGRDRAPSNQRDSWRDFNPRARVGRDPQAPEATSRYSDFNPRARVGRDVEISTSNGDADLFQSTRPCGARPLEVAVRQRRIAFQSTRPCGARRDSSRTMQEFREFQSTRPCGARRAAPEELHARRPISIHAPVWGATIHRHRDLSPAKYFNPRARVGRDTRSQAAGRRTSYFNPRARVGRDELRTKAGKRARHFNPRARVGRDARPLAWREVPLAFQSTRPRGARHEKSCAQEALYLISIHAPAWGATNKIAADCSEFLDFNPRARVGRDT